MKSRIVLTISTAVLLLGLPLAANAAPTFEHLSSIVNSMTLQITTVDSTTGKLKKEVVKFTNGFDSGNEEVDNSEHFETLEDTVVMNSSNSPDFTKLLLDMSADLLLPANGRMASGHASFDLSSPPTAPRTGKQLTAEGSVLLKVAENAMGSKVTIVTKFQPSHAVITTYRNSTTIQVKRCMLGINLPAMVKSAQEVAGP